MDARAASTCSSSTWQNIVYLQDCTSHYNQLQLAHLRGVTGDYGMQCASHSIQLIAIHFRGRNAMSDRAYCHHEFIEIVFS